MGTIKPPTALVDLLLSEAGINERPFEMALVGDSTSNVWSVSVRKWKFIVRHRSDEDAEMAHKEVHLSDLLHRHNVPSPKVLAMVANQEWVGTLSTQLVGIPLDQAVGVLTGNDLDSAWHSTGQALRAAHEIALPEAGEIVGTQIQPFSGGWAQWVLEDVAEDIDWLLGSLNVTKVERSHMECVVALSIGALKDAPIRLVHNDALPQNVIVAPSSDGWRCVGWIDWEFARAGDPLWDIGTLDFRPANLVPASFYEGYDLLPPEPQTSIYELLMAVWRTRVELEHGERWDWPPQSARIDYLRNLSDNIARLAERLGAD